MSNEVLAKFKEFIQLVCREHQFKLVKDYDPLRDTCAVLAVD
eukprot:05187.XXX_123492_123297_1 [CDS] Oithona nana genome sequencing.